jgi:predicted nucleic acid-binding protein
MISVFLDTNVAFDLVSRRDPHYEESKELISAVVHGRLSFKIAEGSVLTLIYLAYDAYKLENATKRLSSFISMCDVLQSSKSVILDALNSEFKDKEDAVQYFTALHHEVDYFITRNKKDYKSFTTHLPVYLPSEFLNRL